MNSGKCSSALSPDISSSSPSAARPFGGRSPCWSNSVRSCATASSSLWTSGILSAICLRSSRFALLRFRPPSLVFQCRRISARPAVPSCCGWNWTSSEPDVATDAAGASSFGASSSAFVLAEVFLLLLLFFSACSSGDLCSRPRPRRREKRERVACVVREPWATSVTLALCWKQRLWR